MGGRLKQKNAAMGTAKRKMEEEETYVLDSFLFLSKLMRYELFKGVLPAGSGTKEDVAFYPSFTLWP